MTIRGIGFPFRKGTTSLPAQVTDNDVIRDNIIRILQTMRGARVMRPNSGSNVWNFVFENTGPVLNARMDHEVRRAIAQGEPRANVLNVGVSEENRNDGGKNIVVTVIYSVNLDVQQAVTSFSQPLQAGG
jgi:phage baseplate assembly protein W